MTEFQLCHRIKELMSGFDKPWFIAGGWAIDLHIGQKTREHKDIEIAVFRHDQAHVKNHLKQWRLQKVVNGELVIWEGENLQRPIHEIHCQNVINGTSLEVLLNEIQHNDWIFRRDERIRYSFEKMKSVHIEDIPYLSPEVVLLYKAKDTRAKDQEDFLRVVDFLSSEEKKWLQTAMQLHMPYHKWLELL
ncbi:hypothetical protein MHI57_16875 [Cytobacillus sp. FSL K6-0129]|uniref:nucleotidyltransferase domain-containing protein n=1 Tax=Cytobacillus sp. FSL K6-0129 TaxID=2921421 RepID=UPI0030F602AD